MAGWPEQPPPRREATASRCPPAEQESRQACPCVRKPATARARRACTETRPARAGDLLTVHALLERTGRTSMTVAVRVTAERRNATTTPATDVATARLTFVAVDAEGRPRPVPGLLEEEPEA
ncbi:acyl-CoA thioesterase [Streptomyces sp. NPDC001373]|uniref:acyl-CoA thioesterase n=1 Tax=Streptomyces sp. NPDC001373 TaxID=3364565 RepID=UPI0036810084